MIPLNELHPFPGHPFRVMMDADMDKLVESVRENGVLVPGIVRPRRQGGYDIISGHRRREASRLAGKPTMPAVVRDDLDDDAATIAMIEVNLKQREKLLPSERAKAYRMMRDALVKQTEGNGDAKSGKAKERIARHFGESASRVMRTIRLTYLNQPLLDMVDSGKMKLGLGIQISYLDTEVQCWIADHHTDTGLWPTTAQVKALRTLYEQGGLTQEAFAEIMAQAPPVIEKPITQTTQEDDFLLSIRDNHFPKMNLDEVKAVILEMVDLYVYRQQRELME